MAITWGSFSGGLRCGIEVTNITTPTNGSATCTVTASFYVGTSGSQTFSDNQQLNTSQTGGTSISVSTTPYFNSMVQNQTALIVSGVTAVYTFSDYGVGHSITLHSNASGLFNGGTPSVSLAVSIPARPYANPAATTSSSVTRVSDAQQTVNWTNNNSSSAAYANIKVYRRTDAGSFALISTIGVVTSYNDNLTVANHKYRYRPNVLGANGVEVTGPETGDVWTTPGAPSSLVATKLAGGNIRLTWTNNVNYSEYTVRIEESQNGGAYSELTSVATGIATYDHVAPSTGVTHKYRIRARTTTGTTLNSNYSNESATITLLSTAGAPTGLAPTGVAKDAAEAIIFTWVHNPTDGTPQTKYQLQYKVNAGSFVTVGPTTSGVSSYTMPAATLTNGDTITWHVATAAENGTVGAYSADSVFTTSARPTSTISSPSGGTYSLSQLTATWTYFQAQSSAQTAWHAYLYHKIGIDYTDAVLVGEKSGSGTTASVTFDTTTLLDGETYGVRVYVTSAAGLDSIDSGTDLEEFTVAYLPPAQATLTAEYEPDFGRMIITIQGDAAVLGVTEAIATVDLQRQINSGDWVTWVTGIVLAAGTLSATVADTMPTINGHNNYRAVIRSATPSSVLSPEVEVITAEERWGFLTTGAGFELLTRMRARLEGKSTSGRDKSTNHFAGREDPVELSGESRSRQFAVQAVLYPPSRGGMSSEPEELEDLAETSTIVLWRDYTGRRMFSSLSDVQTGYNTDSVLYPVAFNLTRVAYDENVG
jgi:hypothetical protein